jgi:hypothetical protein
VFEALGVGQDLCQKHLQRAAAARAMANSAGAVMQALDLLRAQPGDPGPTRNRHKIFW